MRKRCDDMPAIVQDKEKKEVAANAAAAKGQARRTVDKWKKKK